MSIVVTVILVLLSTTLSIHAEVTDTTAQLYADCHRLFNEKQYTQLLELTEAQFSQGPLTYLHPSSVPSIINYMVKAYVQTSQVDQGVDFLFALYSRDADRPGVTLIGSVVFDLALENNRYPVAKEVLDDMAQREPGPFWSADYARLFALMGDYPAALKMLEEGIARRPLTSRTQVIGLPHFVPLHSDPTFQKLVTETPETWAAFQQRWSVWEQDAEPITLQELISLCDFYESITDARMAGEKWLEIYKVDNQVYAHAELYKEDLLQLLAVKSDSLFYQMSLAKILLILGDNALATKVTALLNDKNLEQFPDELCQLAYLAARSSPHAALPLIARLLALDPHTSQDLSEGLFHVQLFLACGVAEPAVMELLLSTARSDYMTSSFNAVLVLHFLAEPQLVPILQEKISATKDVDTWLEYFTALAYLNLPEAREALQAIDIDNLPETIKEQAIELRSSFQQPNKILVGPTIAAIDPALKSIVLSNLEITQGYDLSYVMDILAASVTFDDIEQLKQIRTKILQRASDEALYDHRAITSLINRIRWDQYHSI
jgi:tetratricopeptide (TPR) repeat protein